MKMLNASSFQLIKQETKMASLQPFLHQICQELRNMTPYSLLLLSIALIATISFLNTIAARISSPKLNYPPSPPKLPLIGNIHQLSSLPYRSLVDLSKKYGPIMLLNIGSRKVLVISGIDVLRELVKNHDIEFSNRFVTKGVKTLLCDAKGLVFAPYGEYWRQARKACVLQLLSVSRVNYFQSVREEEVGAIVKRIRASCGNANGVNVTEMLNDASSNIISRCVYGKRSDAEENGKKRVGEVMRDVGLQMGSVCIEDLFPMLGWIDVLTGLVPRMKRTLLELDSSLEQVIKEHKTGPRSSRNEDFVDILLQLQSSGALEFDLTHERLKAIILDMIAAGTDTTETAMEWTMTELVKNPNVLKKVQQEIRKVVGGKQKIEGTDTSQMSYLRCVIKESLRLHSPVPLLVPRETISKVVKLAGYDIPAQTRVFINTWAIQRDCSVWGEDADKFIPERFENSPIDYKGQDFEFLPFGVGRRGCPGMAFGYAVVETVLANLLCWFDWDLPDGLTPENLDMDELFGMTAFKKVNLHLIPTLP